MSAVLGFVFVFVFFAPLAFIYGRVVAGRIHERAEKAGSFARAAVSLLVAPAVLLLCVAVRLADPYALAVALGSLGENAVLAAVLSAADFLGSLALILFFLSVPFVLGRLFAVAAAGLGYFRGAGDNPLRFGVAGAQKGPAKEGRTMTGLMKRPLVVAIDGPAAAGKGTLAKRLAAHYGLPYLDTGLLYRAVGRRAADEGVDLDDPRAVGAVARALAPSALDDGSLRGREAGELASRVAVHPSVRSALIAFQRDFADGPKGAVLDGRDIGSVICPDAALKIFVTASPQVRARRRTDELAAKGRAPDYERILAEVVARDERDMGRADAPLKPAADAHLLDTSDLGIEAVFQAACDLVDRTLARLERS